MARVREAVVVHFEGGLRALSAGQKFDDNDPLVRAFPGHFESDVEMATAGPGERRGVQRSR